MKLSEFKNLHIDDYYWRFVFGKSKFSTSYLNLRTDSFKNLPPPVFFLSTGRCGTNWFTNLLSKNKSIKVLHEPRPNLAIQGRVAWEVYTQSNFKPEPGEKLLLEEIFHTAREQHLRYSFKTQRRYIETNNHASFFAPVIADIFPDAKFVHLNRHPGEFVRSALRRQFFNNLEDIKRIHPLKDYSDAKNWDRFDLLEKNAWLWRETNEFIEQFKKAISAERYFYFNFNELNPEHVNELLEFLGIQIPNKIITKLIGKPTNTQKSGNVSGYSSWKDEDKQKLKNICGDLALKYGYEL